MLGLRKDYDRLVRAELGWQFPPKESFNRWLFERHSAISRVRRTQRCPDTAPQTDQPTTKSNKVEEATKKEEKDEGKKETTQTDPTKRAVEEGAANRAGKERAEGLLLDSLIPQRVLPLVGPSMRHEMLEDLPGKIKPPLRFVRGREAGRVYLTTYCSELRTLLSLHSSEQLLAAALYVAPESTTDTPSSPASSSSSPSSPSSPTSLSSLASSSSLPSSSSSSSSSVPPLPSVPASPTLARIDKLLTAAKEAAEEAEAWLRARKPGRGSYSSDSGDQDGSVVMGKVHELRTTCAPLLEELFGPVIDRVCLRMTALSHEAALATRASISDLQQQCSNKGNAEHGIEEGAKRSHVRVHESRDIVYLDYDGREFSLTPSHFAKLRALYGEAEGFEGAVWRLLARYRSFFGPGPLEGGGHQGAVPPTCLRALKKLFDVSAECFASPLNCFFPRFCSAFHDVDAVFGSLGSFFDTTFTQGSFEANPPFSEELMAGMVSHMHTCLGNSQLPLSFIIIVPHWTEPPSPALTRLDESGFLRVKEIVDKQSHSYVNGLQHDPRTKRPVYTPVHASCVYVLQNEAGVVRWPATPEVMGQVRAAWADVGAQRPRRR